MWCGGHEMTEKKQNIQKCFSMIKDFCRTNNLSQNIEKLLGQYLGNYLKIRRTPTTLEMSKKLNSLLSLAGKDEAYMEAIINKAIESGWASFYPVYGYKKVVDNIPTTRKIQGDGRRDNINLANEKF
jgi:hypothetical protein